MKRNGFTLIELLICIAILIIVVAFGTAAFSSVSPEEETYQPSIEELQLQEAQRANDLKERELNERAAERQKVE
jgi:prepilin-type N-terminal cleavage/methylation domain-containing protein